MGKDLIDLEVILEDDDYKILKKKAEEIGIDRCKRLPHRPLR